MSHIHLEMVKTLNTATLLPIRPGKPNYECAEVMDEVFFSWSDIQDQPLKDPRAISQMVAVL